MLRPTDTSAILNREAVMAFWLYILKCADGSYYTGHTDNLETRIGEHDCGAMPSCYTFTRRPLTLVYSEVFLTRDEAFAAEQRIKGWSRKKKDALIAGDWDEVCRLSKRHSAKSPEVRA